jgi:hypothetical protein
MQVPQAVVVHLAMPVPERRLFFVVRQVLMWAVPVAGRLVRPAIRDTVLVANHDIISVSDTGTFASTAHIASAATAAIFFVLILHPLFAVVRPHAQPGRLTVGSELPIGLRKTISLAENLRWRAGLSFGYAVDTPGPRRSRGFSNEGLTPEVVDTLPEKYRPLMTVGGATTTSKTCQCVVRVRVGPPSKPLR